MFPNFTSLAQREQKRIDLLERTKLRVRQKDESRRMYAEASWASEAGKTISLDKRATQDPNDQAGDGDLKKPSVATENQDNSLKSSQKIPELSSVGINTDLLKVPIMVDAETTARSDMADAEVVAKSSIAHMGSTAKPNVMDRSAGVKPDTADAWIETSETAVIRDHEDQVASRNWIKAFYKANPNWATIGINPVKKDGKDDRKRVIRENGSLRSQFD
ncbi:hypothetical protein ON010_g17940 [Phytophthora cinnamomi]|nr:hypothetical protein ON010_g17940 [Phytophthora cinnamomi]